MAPTDSTCVIQSRRIKVKVPKAKLRKEEESETGLTFINLSEPDQSKDEVLKRTIRSHAMRAYSRSSRQNPSSKLKQRQSPRADFTTEGIENARQSGDVPGNRHWAANPQPTEDQDQVFSYPSNQQQVSVSQGPGSVPSPRFICGDKYCNGDGCSSQMAKWNPRGNPRALIGNGSTDPFDTYPIIGDPKVTGHALKYFLTGLTRKYLPIDSENGSNPFLKDWMPKAMADPLLFLSTLNVAATSLDICQGTRHYPFTLTRKGETMRMINDRMSDRTQIVSDETIGAVLMLAALESVTGNGQDLRIHMKAVERMVTMRGGLRALGWDGVLHMIISWENLLSCALLVTPPECPRVRNSVVISSLLFPSPLATYWPVLDEPNELRVDLMESLRDMRFLTIYADKKRFSGTAAEMMNFANMRATLAHTLLMMQPRKSSTEMTVVDCQLEVVRLGAIMYLQSVFNDRVMPSCAALQTGKRQMIRVLREAEKRDFGEADVQLRCVGLTWALWMGGVLALNVEEENFFAKRIAISLKAWNSHQMAFWSDFEGYLRGICWADRLSCISLWQRVQAMGEGDDELPVWCPYLRDA